MKSKLSLIIFLSALNALPALGFGSADGGPASVHEQITRDALTGTLSETNLKIVIDANLAQDKSGSEGLAELRRHFSDEHLASSLRFIEREKTRALNYACESDTDGQLRGQALTHFGELLHSVQDFYSRSNYLELMFANPTYKNDPYSVPMVDWQKVPDGYPGLETFRAGKSETASFVKDSMSTEGGKKIVSGKVTYFQVARELAVRESQRQWNLFEAMIRNRCGARAAAVIAALKHAAPEASKPLADKDD